MLWHIALKFCIWLCFTVLQIKLECCKYLSIFVGVMPLLELRILEMHSFPHFSLTCFDTLSWKFCIWLWFTVLQIKVECCQFPSIFIRPSSDGTYYGMAMSFRVSFSHSFPHFSHTCFDILSWNFVCHFLYMNIQSSSSIVGFMPLLELRILEIHSLTHFSLTCFDILSWNCAYDFVLLYYRSTLSIINSRQFLLELCLFLK